ncbi:MAG TPA: hypothetical protein VGE37_14825, partial [Archangium sp.]
MFARMDPTFRCALVGCVTVFTGCLSSDLQTELRAVEPVVDAGIDAGAATGGGPCASRPSLGCPGDQSHFCRLDLVVGELESPCVRDEDCMLLPRFDQPENCVSYGLCRVRNSAILVA